MQVVLRQDVEKLGLRGEVVNVARGYARNFLLPRGLAELATPGLVRELERRDAVRAQSEAKTSDEAQAIAARLEKLELRFDANAGPTGSLFGSVTATNVADRLWEQEKIRVDRRKLAVEPIKRVGRYRVPVELFTDVTAELRVVVAPEGQELPAEEELEAAAQAEAEAAAAAAAQAEAQHAEAEAAIAAVEEAPPADEAETPDAPEAPGEPFES
ncbi:MAG TPA: 50S ribosomal protein L9 [Gaiellaceae bacterium]|jgi:large subunit ribosomal protein L9